jgi:type IV pilus assembly protein PilV
MKPMNNPARSPAGRRRGQRGVALIEALVGILIFAFGIIGLVGLQVAMSRAQGNAKYRADATYLTTQALGAIWVDKNNLAQYSTAGNCDSYGPCKDWTDRVAATLPSGTAEITTTPATGVVSMTVTWSTAGEGTHTHVVTSSIN